MTGISCTPNETYHSEADYFSLYTSKLPWAYLIISKMKAVLLSLTSSIRTIWKYDFITTYQQ
jgi:hypothetical protein